MKAIAIILSGLLLTAIVCATGFAWVAMCAEAVR
jgi:hypothetical protein